MDGSAALFGGLVKKVVLGQQTTLIQAIIIDTPLTVCEHHKHAGPVPADECSVDMSINDPVIGW